jgi:hypothetical protein
MIKLTAYEKAKLEREKGKRGENKGIPMPVNWVRMKKILPNIQARYYVILSDSGVGSCKL